MHLADAFIQSDLQLHSGYTFVISMCVPWESNPQPFALLTQCSTTEPHRNTRNYEEKNQNCEIKSHNNLLYFLISGGNELPYYYLMHGLNIILHIRLNPQPLTKRSYKTTLCMCESCQVIFRNNIIYREIARSWKGTSYARSLRMSVSGAFLLFSSAWV